MTHSEMHKLMNSILDNIVKIRDEGQKEYAHDSNDVFANFNRVGNLLEVDKKKVLMTYMLKHVDGIAAYVKGHKSQREDVRGRITDCVVYLMLLWGMIEEEDANIHRPKDNTSMHDVLHPFPDENIGISVAGGSNSSAGVPSNGDMQKMREKGSGIEKLKEVGRD